ncbi:MAG: hypothetical protein Q9213_001787 [Squamulea squamosa]
MAYLTDDDWEGILAGSSSLGENKELSIDRSCLGEPELPNFFDSLLGDTSTCEDHGTKEASTPPTITHSDTSAGGGPGPEGQGRDIFWEIDVLKARVLEQSKTIENLKLDAQILEHLKIDVRNIGMYVMALEPYLNDMRSFIKDLLEKVVVKWEIKSPTLPTLHENGKDG